MRRLPLLGTLVLCAANSLTATAADLPTVLTNLEKTELPLELNSVPNPPLASLPDVNNNRNLRLRDLFLQAADNDSSKLKMTTPRVRRDGDLAGPSLAIPNIVVRIDGEKADEIIVVGAHLDRVDVGTGVIDDWSGSVIVTNLTKRFRETKPRHTFLFVCFAYEENGLWGSQTLVNDLSAVGLLNQVKAMVNLECLGVSGLFIWRNGSDPSLTALAQDVAANFSSPRVTITSRNLTGVGADSVPFTHAGVPAITFDSLGPSDFGKIHTVEDKIGNISVSEYLVAYRFIHDFLRRLDQNVPADTKGAGFWAERRLPLRSYYPSTPSADVGAAGFAAGGRAGPGDDLIRTAIAEANRSWEKAVADWSRALAAKKKARGPEEEKAADDAANAAADLLEGLYSTNALLSPPGSEHVFGRGSIRRYFEGLARFASSVKLETESIETPITTAGPNSAGDRMAYEYGRYTLTGNEGEQERGKTFVKWQIMADPGDPRRLRAYFHSDTWFPTAR